MRVGVFAILWSATVGAQSPASFRGKFAPNRGPIGRAMKVKTDWIGGVNTTGTMFGGARSKVLTVGRLRLVRVRE